MTSQTVFISGATSGIGKATAFLFAKNGWNVIITGRRLDRLDAITKEITTLYPVKAIPLHFDIRDKQVLKDTLSKHKELLSEVNVLLNNAGLALGKSSFEDGLESDWETMIDTNLKGLIYLTKEIIPYFISKKEGHIINISSTAAKEAYPGGNVYSATKYAVDGLTKSLRIDLLPHNIKVSSIAPGMVDTEFSEVRFHGDKTKADAVYQNFTPLYAEDVAETIFFTATRPPHVTIGDIVITCTAQANSVFVYKGE